MNAEDLIFHKDPIKGIYGGGFSIKNFFLNNGIPPLTTLNQTGGGSTNNKVSDLFNDLVVPVSLYYKGGKTFTNKHITESVEEDDDDVLEDSLYNELLNMVTHNPNKKKTTRKNHKKLIHRKTKRNKRL